MSNIYGIDVSAWQGTIDWAKVKRAGCGHAVLKINTKNLAVDKQFAANIKGCKAQGIPYGVYRYVYESTEAAAKKAAQAVVELLRANNAAPGTVVWWDVEDASIKAAAKTTLTASILAAQKVIEAAGYGFGVYCGKYWYDSVLQTGKLTCPFWIARYPSTNAVAFGTAPSAQYKPITTQPLWGWQYSSKGVVPGISGNVDLNQIYGVAATSSYPVPARTLRKGNRGDDVKWMQQRLNVYGAGLAVDGDFGPVTEAAVREYQLRHGLVVDGITGPATRKALGV